MKITSDVPIYGVLSFAIEELIRNNEGRYTKGVRFARQIEDTVIGRGSLT